MTQPNFANRTMWTGDSPVRTVSELFRGCQFLGHTGWEELYIIS